MGLPFTLIVKEFLDQYGVDWTFGLSRVISATWKQFQIYLVSYSLAFVVSFYLALLTFLKISITQDLSTGLIPRK